MEWCYICMLMCGAVVACFDTYYRVPRLSRSPHYLLSLRTPALCAATRHVACGQNIINTYRTTYNHLFGNANSKYTIIMQPG